MPRIFAPNEDYTSTQNYLNFTNGAAAVAATDTDAIAYFTAESCDIDYSKHELTVLDKLTREQIDQIATYLGITLDPTDGKMEVIRDIEDYVSDIELTTLTVTSVAGSTVGDTKVTSTGQGAGQLVYKISETALTPLYMDSAAGWTEFDDGDDITAASLTHVNVAEVDKNGYILGFGSQSVTAATD